MWVVASECCWYIQRVGPRCRPFEPLPKPLVQHIFCGFHSFKTNYIKCWYCLKALWSVQEARSRLYINFRKFSQIFEPIFMRSKFKAHEASRKLINAWQTSKAKRVEFRRPSTSTERIQEILPILLSAFTFLPGMANIIYYSALPQKACPPLTVGHLRRCCCLVGWDMVPLIRENPHTVSYRFSPCDFREQDCGRSCDKWWANCTKTFIYDTRHSVKLGQSLPR